MTKKQLPSAYAMALLVSFCAIPFAIEAQPTGLRVIEASEVQSISQYGITWTFDKEYPTGQFITGDPWVVGPVTVVSVSPEPGPVT
ncbi:MAG: hypothetical protein HC888_09930, partial [Candidatus Competibacteraceae bacterium]|nr:hypothetical protein [Candidatus Competibacteraceae bacterium]